MKPFVLATVVLVFLTGNNTALADRNSHIGSVSGYGHVGYNAGYRSGYYQPSRRGGYYYPPYYGYSRRHNSSNDAAYALGGLVVGSLLTNAYYQNRVSQPVYVEQTYQAPARVVVVRQGVPQTRQLLKNLNGNCYERSTDRFGNELLTELSPSNCNW